MLIFDRKCDQSTVITMPDGRRITITVFRSRTRAGELRIGIDAPRDVICHRGEVQERIDSGEILQRAS